MSSTVHTPGQTQSLGGDGWYLLPDPDDAGKAGDGARHIPADARSVRVPCCIEEHFPRTDGVAWYWRRVKMGSPLPHRTRWFLEFDGADYFAEAWLNGTYLGGNESAMLPFRFDATAALRPGDNLLAVRVIDACYDRAIDGFRLGEVPGGRQHDDPWDPSHRFYNFGGLTGDVRLLAKSVAWIDDAFIQPDPGGGRVTVDVDCGGDAAGARLAATIETAPTAGYPAMVASVSATADGPVVRLALELEDFEPWTLTHPLLYRLNLQMVHRSGEPLDTWSERFGMRTIAYRDGRMHLNGKPLILRGALYNQIYPVTLGRVPPELASRDVELAREANLNFLRMFSKPPAPATLDACDEMGMLAHVETMAAWFMWDGPPEPRKRRLRDQMRRVIRRDRNRPCVLWWVCLNEPPQDEILDYATHELCPELQTLDPSRIIMASDPNRGDWIGVPDVPDAYLPGDPRPRTLYAAKHYYFFENLSITPPRGYSLNGDPPAQVERLRGRSLGQSPQPGKPALFLSEWGLPYMPDWDALLHCYATRAPRQDLEDYELYHRLSSHHGQMFERVGFAQCGFPTLASVAEATQRCAAKRYDEYLTTLWGNVRAFGHCVTSLEDSGYEVSGLVDTWRKPKGLPFEVFRDLNRSPLLNLEVQPRSLYTDQAAGVDVALVQDAPLTPGPCRLLIERIDPAGSVIDHQQIDVTIDAAPILHLHQQVVPVAPVPGEQRLRVTLLNRERPVLSAERILHVFERPGATPATRHRPLLIWDTPEQRLSGFLAAAGRAFNCFENEPVDSGALILVADGEMTAGNADRLAAVFDAVWAGASAAFLDHQFFGARQADTSASDAPFLDTAKIVTADPVHWMRPFAGWKPDPRLPFWGYGGVRFALNHPLLEGLPTGCALGETDVYARCGAVDSWDFLDAPAAVAPDAAVVYANSERLMPYRADLVMLKYGKGRVLLTTLNLVPNLGDDPAADRIVLNVVGR